MTPRENTNREDVVMARLIAVRTTIEPGRVLKVDAAELTDLERQGLIKSREGDEGWKPEEETDEATAAPDAEATKAEKKKGA